MRVQRFGLDAVITFGLTVLAVAMCAVVARFEGNWATGRVTLGFRSHAGMWGDLILMPLVNALVLPRLIAASGGGRVRPRLVVITGILSLTLTVLLHAIWFDSGRILGTTDHVFPTHSAGVWYRDISVAGWGHVLFMTFEIAIVMLYAVMPFSRESIIAVSALLTLHLPFALIGPKLASGNSIVAPDLFLLPAGVLAIWLLAILKLRGLMHGTEAIV